MLKIRMDNPRIGTNLLSSHDSKYKTFEEFEEQLETQGGLANDHWNYVAHAGAVKRRYRFNDSTSKWERVLHPRGTKRKVKKEVARCEFDAGPDEQQNPEGNWLTSAGNIDWLEKNLGKQMTMKGVYHTHRVTYTDGSVVYYTHNGDRILRKYDTLPEWHTGVKPSAEVNVISSTPAEKEVDKADFWNVLSSKWINSSYSYAHLRQILTDKRYNSTFPGATHRVTFTDGSVTYFTRDGEGKPLYETSEDPTVKKMEVTVSPVPVNVPWHVAVEDIVLNNAEYDVHYNEPEGKTTFVVSYNSDYASKLEMDHNDICFSIEPQVFNAKWYKKETK